MEGPIEVHGRVDEIDGSYWRRVLSRGMRVPDDRPLDELTAELTTLLGSPDPETRDGVAYPALATWVDRGVYDDLLAGLGDGMAAGLRVGLGGSGDETVFRRSFSVLVLAACVLRDNRCRLLPGRKVLEWGDHVATWFLRERDDRGWVSGHGWAHAIAHGADALGALAGSPHFGPSELTVLLDVLADRILDGRGPLLAGEPDRMALATMQVLRRDVLDLRVLEPWVARIRSGASALGSTTDRDPYLDAADAQAFLRALHLQLALAPDPPAVRADLLLVLVEALRRTNPDFLALPVEAGHRADRPRGEA